MHGQPRVSYLRDLCKQYKINNHEPVELDFEDFKKSYLSKLDFLDEQMLKTYQLAFFCNYFELKSNVFSKNHSIKYKIFSCVIKEVKRNYKKNTKCQQNYVCNLYSIVYGKP